MKTGISGGLGSRVERQRRVSLSAARWTVLELLLIIAAAGVSSLLASRGAIPLGGCLLLTAVCGRIAIVDYSLAGSVASGLILVVGAPTLFLAVVWAMCF